MSRIDVAPRKVLLGTLISGYEVFGLQVEKRLDKMDELTAAIAAEAKAKYPGKNLDLVVFPEGFLSRPGYTAKDRALRLETVRERLAACAKRHSWHPVPVLMKAPYLRGGDGDKWDEVTCRRGQIGTIPAKALLPLALAHAGKLDKFGA